MMKGRGERSRRCEEHLTTKCTFPTCTLLTLPSATACQYHVCRAIGCLVTLSPALFSSTPTIPSPNFPLQFPTTATNPAVALAPSSPFCDAHRCIEPGCNNPSLNAITTTTIPTTSTTTAGVAGLGGGGMYCIEHAHRLNHRHTYRHGHPHRTCRHHHGLCFRASAGGGCGWPGDSGGGSDSSDDSDGDDTVTDHGDECGGGGGGDGGGGGGAISVDLGTCVHCAGGGSDCGSHGKKKSCHKCA
ncbi:uncharacterized protein F4822DRAFT_266132 [Hypoxylon trugodes]|uniref:uncharacterized protein n=1 Tax=Hypoxylon trugodes TaxID=326681 RepID=UPI002195C62E|nr:uncharacterized protein F4822DRAFT_266132 [Hypoxylon trugodes]KAI1389013.1 hypothetical protein F4822DRAFT_266132 [Hypoxylon trugodes]